MIVRKGQRVSATFDTKAEASIVAGVEANMAKAQAEGPQSKEQLIDRLDAGTG